MSSMLSVDIRARVSAGNRAFGLEASFSSSGGYVVLFGPSGSGKSLTLQCMAGIVRPELGAIAINGRLLFDSERGVDLPVRDRRLGYLFQDYALFPHLSAFENVAFGLGGWLRPRVSGDDREKVMQLLDGFELGCVRDSLPKDLSGGQRQRVALARALITGPDLLLLDEPFSALDHGLRDRMRGRLKEVHDRYDVPMVIVTHDPADVEAFGEAVVEYGGGMARLIPATLKGA